MSIAEDIIDGLCCQLCGVYFEEEHGYPVVCESCYNELSEEEKKDYHYHIKNFTLTQIQPQLLWIYHKEDIL